MASPRKFSEKIALHTQKQAEGTAAFEQIMKEVGSATKGAYPPKQLLHINQALGSYRGGSLPNVNQIGSNSIDLQSALTSLEDMKQGRDSFIDRVSRSRHVGPHRRPFDKRPVHLRNLACTAMAQNAKWCSRDVDVSPYGSPYLSPPPDTSWRRTNSDSALHQSAMNPVDTYQCPSTPPKSRRNMHDCEDGHMNVDESQTKTYWDPPKKQLLLPQQSRPKSCEVPGINIFHTEQEPGVVHIPVSSNTGSLPDLTNLQFQSPLQNPIDEEDQLTDVYNTNQQQLSPTPMSPGIKIEFPSGSNGGGVPATSSTVQSANTASHRRANHGVTNLVIRGSSVMQNSLTVPSSHNTLLHFSKGMTIDAGSMSMDFSQQTQANQVGQYVSYQQQQYGMPSPPDLNNTGNYRSGSPSEPLCSAPPSPVSQTSPSGSPGLGPPPKNSFADHYYRQTANTLLEDFEQINMVDVPHSSAMNNIFNHEANNLQYSQISTMGYIDTNLYYNSPSSQQLDYISRHNQSSVITSGGQLQQTAPQTPQTPNSIPDIILTDFSSGNDDPMAGMNTQFDSDLLISEDLRGFVGPLDLDGLQLLTDPDMVTDPATEDSFRLDRL